jgi:membrane peptidoglycan carboxypeptidase
MTLEPKNTYLFEGEARRARRPPGVKSFLIVLNLQMDWLLDKIREIEQSGDPILWADENSEIERITLLLEDRRFYRHSGFDLHCIPRMIKQAFTFKRIGGISTIEQQLVRTILSRRERTIKRKFREVLLAWILSHRKTKRDILRAYLATAYFGYRLRGCDEVSKLIFCRPAGELSSAQAAVIASLLVYPLPKLVKVSPALLKHLPLDDASEYLKQAAEIAPRWSNRVIRSIGYGLALRRNAK